MNHQQIYDHVLAFMREQKVVAMDDRGHCRFLVPDTGCRCAVGCLFEGQDLADLVSTGLQLPESVRGARPELYRKIAPSDDIDTLTFLKSLQMAHDAFMPKVKGESMDKWEARMQGIATQYSLTYTEPTS